MFLPSLNSCSSVQVLSIWVFRVRVSSRLMTGVNQEFLVRSVYSIASSCETLWGYHLRTTSALKAFRITKINRMFYVTFQNGEICSFQLLIWWCISINWCCILIEVLFYIAYKIILKETGNWSTRELSRRM